MYIILFNINWDKKGHQLISKKKTLASRGYIFHAFLWNSVRMIFRWFLGSFHIWVILGSNSRLPGLKIEKNAKHCRGLIFLPIIKFSHNVSLDTCQAAFVLSKMLIFQWSNVTSDHHEFFSECWTWWRLSLLNIWIIWSQNNAFRSKNKKKSREHCRGYIFHSTSNHHKSL